VLQSVQLKRNSETPTPASHLEHLFIFSPSRQHDSDEFAQKNAIARNGSRVLVVRTVLLPSGIVEFINQGEQYGFDKLSEALRIEKGSANRTTFNAGEVLDSKKYLRQYVEY